MKRVEILLSGSLAQKFGRRHERWLDTSTISEAMNSLKSTIEGFSEAILELDKKKVEFAIFKNRKNVGEDDLGTGGLEELRIVPVISGSKSGGFFGALITGVLVGAAVFFSGGTALVAIGWGLAAAGGMALLSMLSPQPKGLDPSSGDEDGNKASYGFGGAVSTTAAGNNVPLLYGKRMIGGAFASASIVNYDIRV